VTAIGPFAAGILSEYREVFGGTEIPSGELEALLGRNETVTVADLDDIDLLQFVLMTAMRRNSEMIAAVNRGRAAAAIDLGRRTGLVLPHSPNRQQRRHGGR
jgi:hypothetical protein